MGRYYKGKHDWVVLAVYVGFIAAIVILELIAFLGANK